MKRVSNAYKQAMNKRIRDHSYMVVSVGIISNEAQATAAVTSETNYLSNNSFFLHDREISVRYATFEEQQTLADGSALFPPKPEEYYQIADTQCISKDIKGNIVVSFDNAYDIKGLTLDFTDNYPTEFQIIINGSTIYNYTNDVRVFVSTDNYDDVRTITIKPIHFINGDNKRLRLEVMRMGVGIVFQNEDIESASLTDSASFISEELPQLDFSVTCFDRNKRFNVDDENSFINYLEGGQAMNCSIGIELANGDTEWVDMPITYLSSWSSDGNRVSFTGVDRLALLTTKYVDGNTIHTRTLYDDAKAIFDFLEFEPDEYFIDDVLRNVVVTNPLPQVSCAECLQLIANAGRCALKQDSDGAIQLLPNFENIIEPTDIEVSTSDNAYWSKSNIVGEGSAYVYADFTRQFVSADGTFLFLPKTNEATQQSGFVTDEISDDEGYFNTNPSIQMKLPATFTYHSIDFEFAGIPPVSFTVETYDSGVLQDTVVATDITNDYKLTHSFYNFDEIKFIFTQAQPRNRVVLQKVTFGMLSDYRLQKQDMYSNPIGTIEPKTQAVSVKIFSFENKTSGGVTKPSVIEDDVYYTHTLGTVGEVVTFENQLIGTQAHAQQVAEWLANYYSNNVTYTVDYRGEPRIESLDYMYMDSDILNNLQVEVESTSLQFNGALKGSLNLRRAINMISE